MKFEAIFSHLEAAGVSRSVLEEVYSPVGLDLGGETPEELAVSIVAELLAVKNNRPGGHLSRP